jgi:hypothetical protein
VDEAMDFVGIGHRAGHAVPTLSAGEQRRVEIARAIVSRPNILFADEPTGDLDARSAAQMLQILWQLNRGGTTIVMATHSRNARRWRARLSIWPTDCGSTAAKSGERHCGWPGKNAPLGISVSGEKSALSPYFRINLYYAPDSSKNYIHIGRDSPLARPGNPLIPNCPYASAASLMRSSVCPGM